MNEYSIHVSNGKVIGDSTFYILANESLRKECKRLCDYTDALDIMTHKNISWWSNDFIAITRQIISIGGAEYVEYSEFENFNAELLKLLQSYQNIERP